MPKQFWHTLHNSAVLELQICCSEQKKNNITPTGTPDSSALPSALQTRSAVRRVVWTLESEAGNKVRGLLNPLLVRPSARPLVRPICAPSALICPSASNLRAVRPSASPLPHVRLSAHPPPVHPPATVCPSAHLPQSARPPPVRPVRIIQKLPTGLFWS